MAIFLEVVPQLARSASGATTVLEGSECLVFYLGSVPTAATRHPGGVNVLMCDGSVRIVKEVNELVADVARLARTGFNTIIIGPTPQMGYASTRWQLTQGSKQLPALGLTNAGGQAVLIGMLLPAVQAAREAAKRKAPPSGPIAQFKNLVGPGGHLFVLGSHDELLAL